MSNEDTKTDDAVITAEHLISLKPETTGLRGRQAGFEHLKPLNIEQYIVQHQCLNMLLDHPWVRQLKLVSNPYMYKSYGRANYKTNTVELSANVLKEPIQIQREVFIRAICHFIAKKMFDESGEGQAYKLLVQRYMRRSKGQSNSTGNITVTESKEVETAH